MVGSARQSNGDYDRERHQQQFIQAVVREARDKGRDDPLKAGDSITSIAKAFVFSGGGIAISTWIFTLKGIGPDSLVLPAIRSDSMDNFIARYPTWVS